MDHFLGKQTVQNILGLRFANRLFALNGAGDPFCLEPARWELELAPQELSAYARLLLDVIEGDPSLSIRGDEAEECWRIVEPIIDAWRAGATPLRDYPAGSHGLDGG